MTDFHTHILPAVDDGSRSVEESLAIISEMKKQGVKRIAATPHFYANDESVDSFLERRSRAYEKLKHALTDDMEIRLGAEVKFYSGISQLQDLKKLRLEGSKFLLLEMPFSQWTEYAIKEVINIAGSSNVTVVLAHIERYLSFQKKGTLQMLLDNGVLFQCNSSFFAGRFTKSKAFKMIRNNQIHFIGTDCHNMTDRSPNMEIALSALKKKYGEEFVADYINYGNKLIMQNKVN